MLRPLSRKRVRFTNLGGGETNDKLLALVLRLVCTAAELSLLRSSNPLPDDSCEIFFDSLNESNRMRAIDGGRSIWGDGVAMHLSMLLYAKALSLCGNFCNLSTVDVLGEILSMALEWTFSSLSLAGKVFER